jgi:IS5 family transposase
VKLQARTWKATGCVIDSRRCRAVDLLVLNHVRNWSYAVVEREVRANLVYRDFARVGAGKMPDAKTMGRWGTALGPAVIKRIHDRIVELAQADSSLLGMECGC